MKRLVSALLIFSVSVCVCTLSLFYIKKQTDNFTNILESAYQSAKKGKLDESKSLVKDFTKKWDKSEKILLTLIYKEKIDEISFSSKILREYINAEDLPEFFAETKKTIALLNHSWITEVPSFINIL